MVQTIAFLHALMHFFAAILMLLSLCLFVAKVAWNFGVPYAMIHEALKRPAKKHGWSLFIFFDLGLLGMTFIASALAGQYRIASLWMVAVLGIAAIVVCYLHLITVLLAGGWLFGLFKKQGKSVEPDEGKWGGSHVEANNRTAD